MPLHSTSGDHFAGGSAQALVRRRSTAITKCIASTVLSLLKILQLMAIFP